MKKITLLLVMLVCGFGFSQTFTDASVYDMQNGNGTTDLTCGTADELLLTLDLTAESIGTLGSTNVLESITFNVTHTWNADVVISLIDPTGTIEVVLLDDIGGNGDNFVDCTLIDGAAAFPGGNTSNITGSFNPINPLTIPFIGVAADGIWTLRVCDDADLDVGTFGGWSMTFAPTPCTEVVGFNVIEISSTNATIGWDPAIGPPVSYNYEFVPQGNGQGVGVITSGNVLAGGSADAADLLDPSTPYTLWVQTVCGSGTSNYVSFDFTTTMANDACTDAIALSCDDVVAFDTTTATLDNAVTCGTPSWSNNIWYTYTSTNEMETITLSTCNDADYDTKLYVYSGDCGSLVCVANNDDFTGCGGFSSQLEFVTDGSGTTVYRIAVSGYSTPAGGVTSQGTGNLTITCVPAATPPANDLCANPEPLDIGVSETGDITNATSAIANPTCDAFGVISDVWYSFEAPVTGIATVITAIGTADNAWIAVYDACGGTELGCASGATVGGGAGSDGMPGGKQLELTGLTSGVTYYVQVWNDGATARRIEGTFDIVVIEGTLSTTDFDSNKAFTYFPNPVNDNLTLSAQNNIQSIVVFNMLGQEVLRTNPNTINTELNMSELQSGAYFVKVRIANSIETVKIIKE